MKFKHALFLLLICLNIKVYSQQASSEFLNIKGNEKLVFSEKAKKLDSLTNRHLINKDVDLLLADRFELIKWYYKQKSIKKAIELNKENIALMDSLDYANTYFYRRNLYSLGFYQNKNLNLVDAINTLKKLLDNKESDDLALKGAFFLAQIHTELGEYYRSLRYYELTNNIAEQLNHNKYFVRSSIGIASMCKIINTSKSLKKGIITLKQAATLSETLNNDDIPKNDIKYKYMYLIYSELGGLLTDRQDYDFFNGEKYYNKALDIALKQNDSLNIGYVYNDLGQSYLKEKKKEAEFYFNKALNYIKGYNDYLNTSIIEKNLGHYYIDFKEYDKAFEQIQNSINTLVTFDNSKFENLPSKSELNDAKSNYFLCASLIEKADIWLALAKEQPSKKKHLLEAIKTLKLADYLVDKSRLDSKEQKSKLLWRKIASEICTKGTKASLLMNNNENAFYFIEKNKSFLLLEDLILKNDRYNSDIPNFISEKEIELKNRITELENLNKETTNSSNQGQLLLAKENYSQFINGLDLKYRLYYKTLKPAEVIDFKTFKNNHVTKDNAYLEYILNEENGYGLLITKNESKLFEIEDVETLKALTIRYRTLLDTPFKDKTSIAEYTKVSNSLYNTLFPQEIRALIKDKKLTISSDNYLQNIPFESLMTSTKEHNYLIFKNEISYTYSLTFLDENSKVKRNSNENFVGFAPVNFSSELSQLPNTKEELNAIEKLFSTKMYLNEEASSGTFFKESSDAKIIHIASHANANDSISPWIAFHDSKVNLNELYNHNNSAELVVLSACNTSLGELYKGEGVMSLSRGFFNTGSHSVLPTLWEVNDKSSVELLRSFYTNLKNGQRKSLALHNAKLDYLKTNSLSEASPYYWAAFVLIGDDSTIELHSNFSTYYYLFFVVFIILLIFILKKEK